MMTQLKQEIILCLTFAYFNTILYEIFFASPTKFSSNNSTLLEHMQLPFTLPTSIDGIPQKLSFMTLFALLVILLATVYNHQTLIFYVALLKFFELIPLLIDLINLLFIYQSQMENIQHWNFFDRVGLSLAFASIRLIIILQFNRRKCHNRKSRQVVLRFDLAFFILINVTLIRHSPINFIRIGRKIIFILLYFRLNGLLSNKKFWIEFVQSTGYSKHGPVQSSLIEQILSLCWMASFCIITSFVLFTLPSIIIDDNGQLFTPSHMQTSLTVHRFGLTMSIIILWFIHSNTRQSRNTFNRYGIACFCVGYDAMPRGSSTTAVNANK